MSKIVPMLNHTKTTMRIKTKVAYSFFLNDSITQEEQLKTDIHVIYEENRFIFLYY